MLGHSVSYFLSQYWRNVPLYAEKLIPLLDTCLSNNFVYSEKVSEAFYSLIDKYQNTAELPLEDLKEFIKEQGYSYILDLMVQDEDNIKALWYLLVLIHQLKGSKDGLEVVLSLFLDNAESDKISLLESLGEPTESHEGAFYQNKGPSLLTNTLTPVGACPKGSNGTIIYNLPEGSYISGAGTYTLSFINTSLESLGKVNTIRITAKHANTDTSIIYENNYVPFMYPERTINCHFTMRQDESPIKSITLEYTCDYFNKKGACLSNVKITKGGITYLPITGGTVGETGEFYEGFGAEKAFYTYEVNNTSPLGDGSISLVYPTEVEAGNYTLSWSLLSGKDLTNYFKSFKIAVRYTDWDKSEADSGLNTLSIFSSDELPYIMSNKNYSFNFRAIKPFNQIYISYQTVDSESITPTPKGIISNLQLTKDSNTLLIKAIPNMTTKTTPSGSVITNAKFADNHEAFKLFNYTSTEGATPKSDGYVKYDFETGERPTAGDYTFIWTNSSINNNAYFTTVDAYITYIDDTKQQISTQQNMTAVDARTKYNFKFTATKTIKSLTIQYACHYDENGIGGTFSEANLTQTVNVSKGSNITTWYESLPVSTENTFTIESDVDVAKIGSEFFYNFRNFIRHYVYPELQRLKVKYSLEGVQAQRIYSRSKINYNSYLRADKFLVINTTPSDATVTFTVEGQTIVGKTIQVRVGTVVTYTISKPYYETLTETITVMDDTILNKSITELPTFTITLNPVDSATLTPITGSTFSLVSAEGTTSADHISVHQGTVINYTITNTNYITVIGSVTATSSTTIDIPMTAYVSVEELEDLTIEEFEDTNIGDFQG